MIFMRYKNVYCLFYSWFLDCWQLVIVVAYCCITNQALKISILNNLKTNNINKFQLKMKVNLFKDFFSESIQHQQKKIYSILY